MLCLVKILEFPVSCFKTEWEKYWIHRLERKKISEVGLDGSFSYLMSYVGGRWVTVPDLSLGENICSCPFSLTKW